MVGAGFSGGAGSGAAVAGSEPNGDPPNESARAFFSQEPDHAVEQRPVLRGQVRDFDVRAARAARSEEGELSLAVREDLVPPLAHLSELILKKEGFRRVRIFLRLLVRQIVESGDVRGKFVVEVRLEAHERLLPALLPVDFRHALEVDILFARHASNIRAAV